MHLWRFYVESKLCDSYLRKWRIQSEFDLSGLLKALFKVLINTQSNIRSLCFVFFFFLFVFCKNPNKEPNRNTMCFMNAQRKQGLKRKQLDFFFFFALYKSIFRHTHRTNRDTNKPSKYGRWVPFILLIHLVVCSLSPEAHFFRFSKRICACLLKIPGLFLLNLHIELPGDRISLCY